jgi:hypothetical protein
MNRLFLLFVTPILVGCSGIPKNIPPSEQFAKSKFSENRILGCYLTERLLTSRTFREKVIDILGRINPPQSEKAPLNPKFHLNLLIGSSRDSQILHIFIDADGNGYFSQGIKGRRVSFYSAELVEYLKKQKEFNK